MKGIDLTSTQVISLLHGGSGIEVPMFERLRAGEQVYGREEWRGWNAAGPDVRNDRLDDTLEKLSEMLFNFKKLPAPSKITKTKQYKEAVKAVKTVQESRRPRGGWADIDYRVDGTRTRIHGLTLEQTNEARVVGMIDVGLVRDPWRDASEMPEWASRFQFTAEKARRIEGGYMVYLRRIS